MIRFLARRCSQALVVLILVSIIIFILLHLLPGGPARAILGTHATPTTIAAFNRENGLDSPLPAQYWHWLTGVLSGNLGFSYVLNQPVSSLLAQRLPKTAFLAGHLRGAGGADRRAHRAVPGRAPAPALTTTSSPPSRSCCTRRRRSGLRCCSSTCWRSGCTCSRPRRRRARSPAVFGDPSALVLPVATITLVTIAAYSRYVRSSVLDELAQDYVRMARSKGAGLPRRAAAARAPERTVAGGDAARAYRCRSSCPARSSPSRCSTTRASAC